jgi:hypothetical protein
LDQTRCHGGKEVTGLAYYYLWQYVKRGKGESASVIGETWGKRWGSGKRVGCWVTTKGRGGYMFALKLNKKISI